MTDVLLEVGVRHADDARRARAGGADRVEVVGEVGEWTPSGWPSFGLSPAPAVVEEVCAAVDIAVRVVLRLREGFSTDGGELARLRGLARSYVDAGAEGLAFGFLDASTELDGAVLEALLADGDWPWTLHPVLALTLDARHAWPTIAALPRLDAIGVAGSPRGLAAGLDDVLTAAREHPALAGSMLATGGLEAEHVPWLRRAGIRQFRIDEQAHPLGSYKAWVDEDLVRMWRGLIDRCA